MLAKNNPNKLKLMVGKTIWFTGFSASGKSSLALNIHKVLSSKGVSSVILDGDEVRKSLNSDLGYTTSDREENNRRAAHMAKIINNSGVIVIGAFITPTDKIRENIKQIIGADNFTLVYINTPLEVCEKRDIKSLYKKAREGKVKDFSGISSLFEEPSKSDIIIDGLKSIEENTNEILTKLNLI
ncbi:MAG: adenylyl-sulfate kinase [Bacteroidota bacterium]